MITPDRDLRGILLGAWHAERPGLPVKNSPSLPAGLHQQQLLVRQPCHLMTHSAYSGEHDCESVCSISYHHLLQPITSKSLLQPGFHSASLSLPVPSKINQPFQTL